MDEHEFCWDREEAALNERDKARADLDVLRLNIQMLADKLFEVGTTEEVLDIVGDLRAAASPRTPPRPPDPESTAPC